MEADDLVRDYARECEGALFGVVVLIILLHESFVSRKGYENNR